MKNNSIISIITPSYNQGKFVEDTIRSVLTQIGDFYIDYIIMDGGSVDQSAEIIRRYEKLLHDNCTIISHNGASYYTSKRNDFEFCRCRGISFRWASEKDSGQSHAVNKGLTMARGDVVAWINSDDYYENQFVFQNIILFFQTHRDCSMVYGRGYCVDSDRNVIRDYHDNCSTLDFDRGILKHQCFILQPAVFIKREVMEAVGPIDESLQWCMDYELWLRISASYRIMLIPLWIANWRQHPGIKTQEENYNYYRERYIIIKKYCTRAEFIIQKWYYYMRQPGHLRHHIWLKYKPGRLSMATCYSFAVLFHTFIKLIARFSKYHIDGSKGERLAIFSPMEPLQTGVATFFSMLLRFLAIEKPDLCIDIYVDDGYVPAYFRLGNVRVLNHGFFLINAPYYKQIFYQMGNNYGYHGYMIPYLKKYPGIVEMHDIKIRGIYSFLIDRVFSSVKQLKLISLSKLLIEYPELLYFFFAKILRPYINKETFLDRYFFNKTFPVRKSKKIIIRDKSICSRFNLPEIKCAIIEHGIDIKPLSDEARKILIRKRLGIEKDRFLIVSAGMIHNSKQIDKVLQALSLIKDRVPNFLYILAGESIWEGCGIQQLIESNGLEHRVRITGWISYEDWFDYLTIADIAVNLRRDSAGEHSGPLVNFIERGKVTLISDYDQYRIYPDEFTIKIQPGPNKIESISDTILWLYNNPQYRAAAGAAARRYAEDKLNFGKSIINQYTAILNL